MSPTHPTPDKGSIREIAMGEITVSITPDDHLESPYLLKTRELPGAPPPGPPAGIKPVGGARGARSAPQFFGKSYIRHYTRGVDLGGEGAAAPNENIG